ncbi:unnamed protein product [Rhodiola kirilowii]
MRLNFFSSIKRHQSFLLRSNSSLPSQPAAASLICPRSAATNNPKHRHSARQRRTPTPHSNRLCANERLVIPLETVGNGVVDTQEKKQEII